MTTLVQIGVHATTSLNGFELPRLSAGWLKSESGGKEDVRNRRPNWMGLRAMLLAVFLMGVASMSANAQTLVATVPIGPHPSAIAVNQTTNMVYVADLDIDTVTVIDGTTNAATTIQTGGNNSLEDLALDATTNTVYAVKSGLFGGGSGVVVIDGATNAITTTITLPQYGSHIAVNPVTNQIYVSTTSGVGNGATANVTVIDGSTNTIATTISIAAPNLVSALAVDTTRNLIYAMDVNEPGNANLTVIDGTSNTVTATVQVGYDNTALALNQTTNTIYVPDQHANQIWVIDGATDSVTTTVAIPGTLENYGIGVNPVTNKIYLVDLVNNVLGVQAVDGSTNILGSSAVSDPSIGPLLVNSTTNMVWQASSPVVIIDGASNSATTVSGTSGINIGALNTSTNYAYMAAANNLYVINGAASGPAFSASPSPVVFGNQTEDTTSSPMTLTVTNAGTTDLNITTVTAGGANMADFPASSDTCSGATVSAGSTCTLSIKFSPSTAAAESATLTFTDNASGGPQVVNLTGTGVAPVQTPTTTALAASATSVAYGTSVTFTATVMPTTGTPTPTGTVTFKDGATTLGTGTLNGSGVATYATAALAVGSHSVTASYGGDAMNQASVSSAASVSVTVIGSASSPTFTPAAGTYVGTQSVTIADTIPGAMIYYTTDGSTPPGSPTSTLYSGPVSVAASETINAIAEAPGYSNSAVVSAAYVINVLPPSYAITIAPSTLTMENGQSATATITVTPQNGFNSAVSLACTGLTIGLTCAVGSPTVTPSGSAPATIPITITALVNPGNLVENRTLNPLFPGTTLALALCLFGWRKRRGVLLLMLMLALGIASLGLLDGCGGSKQPHATAVVVQTSSGGIQQNATLTVIID